jgi:hypothetical protein
MSWQSVILVAIIVFAVVVVLVVAMFCATFKGLGK